jgi:hypothetical protein
MTSGMPFGLFKTMEIRDFWHKESNFPEALISARIYCLNEKLATEGCIA